MDKNGTGERFAKKLIVVKGAGDIASGIAARLYDSGFAVVMTELERPTAVRRAVSFAQAVFEGRTEVEGITAVCVDAARCREYLAQSVIPLLIDPAGECVPVLRPDAVVDAIMAKRNTGTASGDAPAVVGVGPGFAAAEDVDAVVETLRGHDLGRVYYHGRAADDTGAPDEIGGAAAPRLLRAPHCGVFQSRRSIGDSVAAGEAVGYVGDAPVRAGLAGILRGVLCDGLRVTAGMKIGDVDPRCQRIHCFTISDQARAVAGGVLEAVLSLWPRQGRPAA